MLRNKRFALTCIAYNAFVISAITAAATTCAAQEFSFDSAERVLTGCTAQGVCPDGTKIECSAGSGGKCQTVKKLDDKGNPTDVTVSVQCRPKSGSPIETVNCDGSTATDVVEEELQLAPLDAY